MTTSTIGSTFEHELGARGRFVARLRVGDITVRAVDGEVARIRDSEGRDLGESIGIQAGPGELEIQPMGEKGLGFVLSIGSRRFGRGGDLEIDLPRGTAVSLETTSGEIDVDGIQGPGHYRSASGGIRLRGVRGVLEVSAISGDVEIAAEDEIALQLRTVSGDARVRAPRISRLGLTTVSGDVRVDGDLSGAGPYALETLSGDATVVVYRGLRVDARTITGELRSDLEPRAQAGGGRRSLVVGDGETSLTFKSVSGGLRLAAPRGTHASGRRGGALAAAEAATTTAATDTDPGDTNPGDLEGADPRLEILRGLERGDLGIEEATARLAELDEQEGTR